MQQLEDLFPGGQDAETKNTAATFKQIHFDIKARCIDLAETTYASVSSDI